MLFQNIPATMPATPYLPGFEPYDFKNWKSPQSADATAGLESNEDEKLERLINNRQIALNDRQKDAIRNFVETVANETTATLGGIPAFEKLSRILCRDYKDQKGGRCEVALQMGSDAHLIRFGWIVKISSEAGQEEESVQFGITCLKKVTGLSKSEMTLIRGLNSWVKDSSLRWLRKQLLHCLRENLSIEEFSLNWRKSFDFDNFQRAMQRILSEPDRFAMAYTDEATRLRFAGRTLSACKGAGFLLAVGLPVPHELVRRVLRGAKKLYSI